MKSQILPRSINNGPSRNYPCILQLKANHSIVVLFYESGDGGIVLSVPKDGDKSRIGAKESWLNSELNCWQEFKGTIQLSN